MKQNNKVKRKDGLESNVTNSCIVDLGVYHKINGIKNNIKKIGEFDEKVKEDLLTSKVVVK